MARKGTPAPPPPPSDDAAESIAEWFQAHLREVAIGAILVLVVAAGTWLWRASAEKKAVNASQALGDAQRVFASGNLPLAQSDLQRLVQRYSGTNAALEGRLLLAQVYFQQDKVDEGLKVLRDAGAGGPFESSIHSVLAGGLEQQGKSAEAAAEYLKAAETALDEDSKSTMKAEAARAFEAAGDSSRALQLWTELASDDTNPMSGEARIRIGELEAKAVSNG
jgi:predicted negative regulator of RcsB-dependent stress response